MSKILEVFLINFVPDLVSEQSNVFLLVYLYEDFRSENLPNCPVQGQIKEEYGRIPTVSYFIHLVVVDVHLAVILLLHIGCENDSLASRARLALHLRRGKDHRGVW